MAADDAEPAPLLPSPYWGSVLAGTGGGWRVLLQGSELLAHGGLDARDVDGTTLLHAAAARGDLPTVAALLHSGADPFIPDDAGRTAELYAAAGKHEAAAAMLALVGVRYEYARRYELPNFDVGAALGTMVRTADAEETEINSTLAAQHTAWLSSQAAHGKPMPGAPLRALRPPYDLGHRQKKPKQRKWLPEGWTPPPGKPPPPEPEPEEPEPLDDEGRPLRDLYQGAALSGLSEGGPTWQRYDLAVRVVEVRSTRRPTMLVARVVGSDGKISGVGRAEFTEPGNIHMDWVIYGGLDEVTELQLGIDPAALYDEEAIRLIFDSMDADESGELEPSEVRQLCESLAQRLLSQAELASALASMDPDGDGTVVFDEFFQWWKSAVGDPGGMFSSLFAMGCKVEKANLCLPSGGQAIFTPRCWVDVQSSAEGTDAVAAVEPENEEQEEPIRDKDKLKAKAREAVAVSGMRPFPVTRRLKPPPAVDPSAAPKPGARRGAKNWPGLGDVVELAPDAKAEGKSGEARCLAAGGAIGQVVAEATGKGGARRFRVAADSDGSESWYELVELAPHKTEQQGYVAKGSLMEQRKGAEAHVLSLGLVGVASWPLHLLYGKEDEGGEEMLLRLGRHGILTTAQLRNAITAIPWAVQGLTDDEIQGVAGNASLNYPFEAYYSGKVPAVSVGKKGKPPAKGVVARPCVLNHRLLVGTSSAKKQKDKGQKSSSAKRQWITTPLMDVILDAIGPDPLAEFAGGLGDTTVIPGRFLHAVALRSIPPPRSPSAVAQAPPVSAPILTALLSADLLHLRPQLRAFGLCDPVSLLPTLEGVAEMSEGQLMNVPLNKLLRDLRESSGDNTLRPISIPTLRILAGRVAGRQAGLDLTELDGCRLTGRRGTEWDAVPQNLSHKTLDLLASGQLSDAGKGDGQPGDVVYIEGNMPLLLVVPYGGMDAQGGKGGGGSVWWNDWAVPHSQGGGGGGGGKKCLGAIGAVNLARAVHAAIGEMCGSTPHVIVNQLRAHWCMTTSPRADGIDGTGDIPEGTRAKRSGAAWDNYHTFIEVAKGRMQRLHSSLLKKGVGGAVSPGDTPSLVLELEWSGDASDGGAAADPWLIGLGLTGRPLRTAVSAGSGRASTGGGAGGAAGRQQILRVFKRFDADGSGSIDGSELRAAAGELGIELCEQDTADIMQELDADGSGQIELQEFEDWFSGLLGGAGGGGGQLEQLQVRAVLATSSVWGVAQRQQQPLPGTNVTGSPRQSISGMSSLGAHLSAVGIGCTPSPDMPEARQSSGVPMQLPKVSFSLLSHGSASEGGILSTDAMAIYAPAAECAAEAVDGKGGWGERLGMGLLTYLAAQYSWQATPCLAPR